MSKSIPRLVAAAAVALACVAPGTAMAARPTPAPTCLQLPPDLSLPLLHHGTDLIGNHGSATYIASTARGPGPRVITVTRGPGVFAGSLACVSVSPGGAVRAIPQAMVGWLPGAPSAWRTPNGLFP